MELQLAKSSSHAVFSIRLHIVFVTRFRNKAFTPEMLDFLRVAFSENLEHWRCRLIEFGGEADHVHLLIDIHPALNLSELINNLKSASSRRLRHVYQDHLSKFYWKPYLWNRAYFMSSVGNVSLDTIKKYIEKQGKTKRAKPSA
jgi:putative transposase